MSARVPAIGERAGRVTAVVGVFLIVGPILGLAGFAASIALYGLMTPRPLDMAATAATMVIYGLFFAHFMGAVPALISGVIVAVGAMWRRTALPAWTGGVIGSIASAVVLTKPGMSMPETGVDRTVVVALLVGGALAGAVCTRLTRRWQG